MKLGRAVTTLLLVLPTAALALLGLSVLIGVRIKSFSALPEDNRAMVSELAGLEEDHDYPWRNLLPGGDLVCILPKDVDPRSALAQQVGSPVEVDGQEIGALREFHWTVAVVKSGHARLFLVPFSQVLLEARGPSCQPYEDATFHVSEKDRRKVTPILPGR